MHEQIPCCCLCPTCVVVGGLEDDALLEAVVLLGSLAGWAEGDHELAESGLVGIALHCKCETCSIA